MKIRKGFVSNSSSSSFIIIDAKNGYTFDLHPKNGVFTAGSEIGETEFGWGPEILRDCGSRVNFAYLQAVYSGSEGWIEMLEEVLKENLSIEIIEWNMSTKYSSTSKDYAYIDHQSVGDENTSMFDSKETLKDFLFGNGSKICLDNDNY